MKQDIRSYLFIAVAFLLGSTNILYGIGFYIVWILVAIFLVWKDYQGFQENLRKNWKYLLLPLCGVLYLVIHYILSLFIRDIPYRVSWSRIELLLLYFFFIPLYMVAARNFMTARILKQSLLALCWGVMLFNFTKLFYLTGFTLFTTPSETLNMLFDSRFGGHLSFLGGHVYLEPQAIYLSVTAIVAYFFMLKALVGLDRKLLISSSVLFVLSLFFLALTVTKGAILAFLCSFFILSVIYFRRISYKNRLLISGVIILLLVLVCSFIPKMYVERFKEMSTEIENIQQGEYAGGTVAPRLALLKESFSHFDQWGIWGLGVYKNAAAYDWFTHSKYASIHNLRSNVHNSFMEFWMVGGIAGLFFILYYFFVPIWRMMRKRQYSFLIIAIILALIIGNSTAILIVFVDSVPFIIFLLSMFFIFGDYFYKLEQLPDKIIESE